MFDWNEILVIVNSDFEFNGINISTGFGHFPLSIPPWNYQSNTGFSDNFTGYRKGTLTINGLE